MQYPMTECTLHTDTFCPPVWLWPHIELTIFSNKILHQKKIHTNCVLAETSKSDLPIFFILELDVTEYPTRKSSLVQRDCYFLFFQDRRNLEDYVEVCQRQTQPEMWQDTEGGGLDENIRMLLLFCWQHWPQSYL